MEYLIVGIASYLMGSIPFGLILTKIFLKKDIRDIGSGNIGATNVLRTGNKLIGYLTLVLDITKAIIPVIYVKINFPELINVLKESICLNSPALNFLSYLSALISLKLKFLSITYPFSKGLNSTVKPFPNNFIVQPPGEYQCEI